MLRFENISYWHGIFQICRHTCFFGEYDHFLETGVLPHCCFDCLQRPTIMSGSFMFVICSNMDRCIVHNCEKSWVTEACDYYGGRTLGPECRGTVHQINLDNARRVHANFYCAFLFSTFFSLSAFGYSSLPRGVNQRFRIETERRPDDNEQTLAQKNHFTCHDDSCATDAQSVNVLRKGNRALSLIFAQSILIMVLCVKFVIPSGFHSPALSVA
jgi:hypothetical protein